MNYYLLKTLKQNGLKMDFSIDAIVFQQSMKNPQKFQDLIYDLVIKKKISMNEFKIGVKKYYNDGKESTAVADVDDCLERIFSSIGIHLSDEIMYPYRNALIKDTMTMQELMNGEIMEFLFAEIEFCSELSINHFGLITFPKAVTSISKKHVQQCFMNAFSSMPYESERLMQSLCFIILNTKAEQDLKNLKKK